MKDLNYYLSRHLDSSMQCIHERHELLSVLDPELGVALTIFLPFSPLFVVFSQDSEHVQGVPAVSTCV